MHSRLSRPFSLLLILLALAFSASAAGASCLTQIVSDTMLPGYPNHGTVDADDTDDTWATSSSSPKLDADCEAWTFDGGTSSYAGVEYDMADHGDDSLWFGGSLTGPFGAIGGGSSAVYECSEAHCPNWDGDCCADDDSCPGCENEVSGYNGWHQTQALELESGDGTAWITQAVLANAGDGISTDADPDRIDYYTNVYAWYDCFKNIRDDALEDDWRSHRLYAAESVFHRISGYVMAYRARNSAQDRVPPSNWQMRLRGNYILFRKLGNTYEGDPKFRGLFKEEHYGHCSDGTTECNGDSDCTGIGTEVCTVYKPSIVFEENHVFIPGPESGTQYKLDYDQDGTGGETNGDDDPGIPSIFPDPDVTACGDGNHYYFGGTQTQWNNLKNAGVNNGRLEALNADPEEPCITVHVLGATYTDDFYDYVDTTFETNTGITTCGGY